MGVVKIQNRLESSHRLEDETLEGARIVPKREGSGYLAPERAESQSSTIRQCLGQHRALSVEVQLPERTHPETLGKKQCLTV